MSSQAFPVLEQKTHSNSRTPSNTWSSSCRHSMAALSQYETLLVSSSGDVIVCCDKQQDKHTHQRQSSNNYDCVPMENCDDLSTRMQETSFFCDTSACNPWQTHTNYNKRGGLLGGAPPEDPLQSRLPVGSGKSRQPLHHNGTETNAVTTVQHNKESTCSLSPTRNGLDAIYPIQSFDYSHYQDGMNDMLSEQKHRQKEKTTSANRSTMVSTIPGIPSFHNVFSQIRVTHVSAHPLGGHVLLISHVGLLYSYGRNDFGQLGVGITSPLDGLDGGYIREPTIVTPLVEHGGKAIACAAGVDHSIVVISTKEERLKTQLSPTIESNSINPTPKGSASRVYQHQVYAFGRNDGGKLGLLRKDDMQHCHSVSLPHRVALQCQAENQYEGIVSISASLNHSMALLRRKGDVELYTWGSGPACEPSMSHESLIPTLVPALSVCSQALKQCILSRENQEVVASIATANDISFATTSSGRCFVLGSNQEGMLGLGHGRTCAKEPTQLVMPTDVDGVVSVSAGAHHVLAVTWTGQVYCWGDTRYAGVINSNESISWMPQQVKISEDSDAKENCVTVLYPFAGYDCSVYITESGNVYSGGTGTGRLGVGEIFASVQPPCPLFGGLRLWRQNLLPPQMPAMSSRTAHLARGVTIS